MASRLDRLFLLLDQGSSPLTRKAAAVQLGEVQKLHPHELHNLLAKLHRYLYSSNWDTRIAAGQAVEAIISKVPEWNPQSLAIKEGEDAANSYEPSLAGRMKFSEFDINKVIQNGSNLLACESSKVEMDELEGLDPQEHLAKQRQMLNKHLGLNFSSFLGMDSNYISNDDFEVNNHMPTKMKVECKIETKEDNSNSIPAYDMTIKNSNNFDDPPLKKRRLSENNCMKKSFSTDSNDNNLESFEEPKQWPLEGFSDKLVHDLLNASWEVRHGAATALREIIRIHGRGAGKQINSSPEKMEIFNQLWLEDLALRLTCVLALDKFGDFISDQVVAPVRETSAQVLGAVVNIMSTKRVSLVLRILLQLLCRSEWEARHGGLLGLKYILSVRKDLKSTMIPHVFEPVCLCLKDSVDDVSAVAASALVPVTDVIVTTLPEKISSVILSLWDAILDLDDLTVSTSSILQLLASLLSCSSKHCSISLSTNLDELVPRLWPFLSHNSSIVRKSVLQTLITLTSIDHKQEEVLWIANILQPALQLVFQRCLVEHVPEVHELLLKVWRNMILKAPPISVISSTVPLLGAWISMLMQPSNVPFDSSSNSAWLEVPHKMKEKFTDRCRVSSGYSMSSQELHLIGGNASANESCKDRERNIIAAKVTGAKFIGFLTSYITKDISGLTFVPGAEAPIEAFAKIVLFHLNFKSAQQRFAISLVLNEWAMFQQENLCPDPVKEKCLECLNEIVYYDEIAIVFARLQQDCKDFILQLKQHSIPIDPVFQNNSVFTFEQIIQLTSSISTILPFKKLKPKVIEALEEKRKLLLKGVTQTSDDQTSLRVMVQSTIAGALISLKYLPEKLNPVIRPLMDSIKKEENELLQQASAHNLVNLMENCVSRSNSPNPKIIKNLTNFLCYDVVSLDFNHLNSGKTTETAVMSASTSNNYHKQTEIITLLDMQKSAEKVLFRRSNSVAKKTLVAQPSEECSLEDENQKINELQARGATYVFTHSAEHFGPCLPEKLPNLWESIFHPFQKYIKVEGTGSAVFSPDANLPEILCSLQILKTISSHFHQKLHVHLEAILRPVCCCLDHPLSMVRHKAASCLGRLCKVIPGPTMNLILDTVLAGLGASDNDVQRQGAVEAVACIIEELRLNIVPYIVFLIVPLLGRMSDQNEQVRLLATHCFASLIKLMPLENGNKNPALQPAMESKKEQERLFLEQLINPKKVEPYVIPIPINAELRSYQQEGVNWLAFLNKYKLNGILCDDMGLGKTLQSICILAGDHYNREQAYKESKKPDCKPLPSLVVCPPTLTGHWVYEVEKFVKPHYLNPIHYTGPPAERLRLRNKTRMHNLVIASYDIVRNDIDFFGSIHWNYCILDEGHVIKNGKTKLARAIKQLSANHRLILSGTPIQNNVLELWSLFDFLMPGFLGTERQFTARYSKPILQSRDAKSSSKEQEIGVLAMESLHRQILPFLLRRMKEDVLKDLPSKIIQDYYCELSPLQVRLYEDFSKSRARQSAANVIKDGETPSSRGSSHVFQALQYLRKVCNHPKLVLLPSHPEYQSIFEGLKQQNSSMSDIGHASKLCALRQLLQDCGIGVSNAEQNEPTPAVNQHRALIFCQLKGMLDILENDLFKHMMPSVSYLRLDGSIPHGLRHSVVHKFNNDPSFDALLLTTQVGGLGLNLTGADTVIFVEHDWNPMKDLQAMDRAHRIGQKKVVNVYRLITRGTLEEKIMGLQKFKVSVANSVINHENTSLQNMGTDQLLDLFSLDNKGEKITSSNNSEEAGDSKGRGIKSVLENLPELWDTSQYENEYDLDNFLQSLK